MSPRSLQVLPNYIPQVKSAFKKRYIRQRDLARDAKTGANSVSHFLNGKPVVRKNFCQLCHCLGIDWETIASVDFSDSSDISLDPEASNTSNCSYFVGRGTAIRELKELVNQKAKIILIYGEGGVGKSSLSWQFLSTQEYDLILEVWMAKETKNITPAKSVVEEWLRRHFNDQPMGDFAATLERLEQKLRNKNKRVGILIDNLEPALDKNGNLIPLHHDYVELLKVLANPAGNCVTLITSRERLAETAVDCHGYRLVGLDLKAWEKFFSSQNINPNSHALPAIHAAYAGNAKAMHIISGVIDIDWAGDVDAYWDANEKYLLMERDLEDLVATQFNRLQEIDPQAYKLLCRLGCYRYQDVRSVSLAGVMYLLWDLPEVERLRVVKSVSDRSLLDFINDEYWLHPVIRAEAIARLRNSEEWELVNRKAAEFWTESVETVETGEDALQALEAYYHYIELNDFEKAAETILKERKTKLSYLGEEESLNDSFGRLGLWQYMISAIGFIIDKVDREYFLLILYGYLGGQYQRSGNIQKALIYYQQSRAMAIKCQNKYPQNNNKLSQKIIQQGIANLLSMSNCKFTLGETEQAIKFYEKVNLLAENANLRLFVAFSYFGLARLYSDPKSEKHDRQKAYDSLEKGYQVYRGISVQMLTAWSEVYSCLIAGIVYRNLGENQQALSMFEQTITYAEESKSRLVKGQALHELAVLYRNLNEFDIAINKHDEAREILWQLKAESSLAMLYYEMGLTYQRIGDVENSNKNFKVAIQLFDRIVAPKQIDKVEKAMGGEE